MPLASSLSFPILPSSPISPLSERYIHYTRAYTPLSPLPSPLMSPTSIGALPTSPTPLAMAPGPGTPGTRNGIPRSQSFSQSSPSKLSTPSSSASTSKNYHPYAIQTTSSANLTRSNSSPAQPLSVSGGHRPSRSMSSLNHILDQTGADALHEKEKGKEKEDRRRSMESPSRPGPMRRSGTLPDFLLGSKRDKVEKEMDLPINPKQWTPSELAQYLSHTLRTGGPDGTGQILPAPLVEDIKSWVLRQRVSGRTFLRGSSEGWGNTTRPPPFLPLLQTIARRLRRNSLTGRLDVPLSVNPDDSFGRGSILLEEDEGLSELDATEEGISGVRRMAIAFDARSSASETSASGDEAELELDHHFHPHPQKLTAQWTGESVGERWKKWEDRSHGRPRNVSDVSSASASSVGGLGDAELSPTLESEVFASIGRDVRDEDYEASQGEGGTIKAPPLLTSPSPSSSSTGLTPPPPYTSYFPDHTRAPTMPTLTEVLTPERGRVSVTPTPERPAHSHGQSSGLGILTPSPNVTPSKLASGAQGQLDSPHMANMTNHSSLDSNPYAALRRRSSSGAGGGSGGPRYPTVRSLVLSQADDGDEGDEADEEGASVQPAKLSPPANGSGQWAREKLEGSRWTTARRVTLRPGKVQSIFEDGDKSSFSQSVSEMEAETKLHQDNSESREAKREGEERDQKVEQKMNKLLERIQELENRLEAVSSPTTSTPSTASAAPAVDDNAANKLVKKRVHEPTLLDLFGFGGSLSGSGADDDGLPRRMRELPAYLFLVGVGVGAVMVRVLFGRAR